MVKSDSKLGGLNIILIGIISVLYILLVTKLAEMMSLSYENSENQISVYVTIIYFISIMGMIVGYAYLSGSGSESKSGAKSGAKSSEDTKTPDWILKWSFNVGGVLLIIYSITNYWDYMSDYTKLSIIALSIICIVYYIYKFYEK